jgi:signal transduction histidine kinase
VLCIHDAKPRSLDAQGVQLLQAFGALAQQAREAQSRDRARVEAARTRLVSPAVHLIRGALTNIHGFSEFLLSHDADDTQRREFMGVIHEQANQLSSVVTELADLFRIETGAGREMKSAVHGLGALLTASVLDCGLAQRVHWQAPENSPQVTIDLMQTQHALCALIKAVAVEPQSSEALEIAVSAGTARFATVIFSYPPSCFAALSKLEIFEPFHFAKDSEPKIIGASLALAKNIIEAQGGEFEVARDVKLQQVRFVLRLPLSA